MPSIAQRADAMDGIELPITASYRFVSRDLLRSSYASSYYIILRKARNFSFECAIPIKFFPRRAPTRRSS